jgi:hypothetical protein
MFGLADAWATIIKNVKDKNAACDVMGGLNLGRERLAEYV